VGINSKNYSLFLKLLETNNKWIVDGLLGVVTFGIYTPTTTKVQM
jgi:hypothetical protein